MRSLFVLLLLPSLVFAQTYDRIYQPDGSSQLLSRPAS